MMSQYIAQAEQLWAEAVQIWLSGGWAMIALAINALLLFGIGANLWVRLKIRTARVPKSVWRRWIARADEREGKVGELIDFAMDASDLKDMRVRFDEMNASEVGLYERDLRFLKQAVNTAPLLGLLGTVTGMLTTFNGLAAGSGGDQTMDMVAGGISEALITTETGLLIAVPGMFLRYQLTRKRDRYEAFLAYLETACTQHFCLRRRAGGPAGQTSGGVSAAPAAQIEGTAT
jgi:biopolymer transport protein ExbB